MIGKKYPEAERILKPHRERKGFRQRDIPEWMRSHCDTCSENWKRSGPNRVSQYVNGTRGPETRTDAVHLGVVLELPFEELRELMKIWEYDPVEETEFSELSVAYRLNSAGSEDYVLDKETDTKDPRPVAPDLPLHHGGQHKPGLGVAHARNRISEWWEWQFSDSPGETFPFGVSLFFILGCSTPGVAVTRLDPFALHRWFPNITSTASLIVITLGLYLGLAIVATVIFHRLGNRKRGASTVYPRAIWRVFPPLVLVLVVLLVFAGSIMAATYYFVVLTLLGIAFAAIVAFRDKEFELDEKGKERLINHVWTATLILVAGCVLFTVTVQLNPDSILSVNDTLLLGTWDIDFEYLGYTEAEFLGKLRDSSFFSNIAMTVCLLGISLYALRTVYGLAPRVTSRQLE